MPTGTCSGYNRKVAACTHMQDLGPSSAQLTNLISFSATAAVLHLGRLVPPLQLRAALPRHNPWWIGVLYSSSFPHSVSSTPLLCLPPARTTHQAPHPSPDQPHRRRPFSAHHQLCVPLLPFSCTPGAHPPTLHPWPASCPAFPPSSWRAHILCRDDASSRYKASQSISATLLCSTLSFQRTGRGNIDLPPGT